MKYICNAKGKAMQNEILSIMKVLLGGSKRVRPVDTHDFEVLEGIRPSLTFVPAVTMFKEKLDDSLTRSVARLVIDYGEIKNATETLLNTDYGRLYNYGITTMRKADRYLSHMLTFLCNYTDIVFMLIVREETGFVVHYTEPMKFMELGKAQNGYTSEGLQYLAGMIQKGYIECELVSEVVEKIVPNSTVTIHRYLGHGATANVFKVTRQGEQNKEAMKLAICDEYIQCIAKEARFLQEVCVGVTGVPQVTHVEPNAIYMKVVKPMRIEDWTEKRMKDLVTVLKSMHEKGYYHRDIRPANIGLDGDQPVLLDWGYYDDAAHSGVKFNGSTPFAAISHVYDEDNPLDNYQQRGDCESLLKTFCFCDTETRRQLLPIMWTSNTYKRQRLSRKFWKKYMASNKPFRDCIYDLIEDDPYDVLNTYIMCRNAPTLEKGQL
jgi:hypothetical protein